MAALLAVGIGLGAEKLGRKISEKRLEHKEKKTAAKREAVYGTAESSSSSARAAQDGCCGNDQKREEARQELGEARRQDFRGSRRSLSEERYGEDGPPPPRYEDVVREDRRGAGT